MAEECACLHKIERSADMQSVGSNEVAYVLWLHFLYSERNHQFFHYFMSQTNT